MQKKTRAAQPGQAEQQREGVHGDQARIQAPFRQSRLPGFRQARRQGNAHGLDSLAANRAARQTNAVPKRRRLTGEFRFQQKSEGLPGLDAGAEGKAPVPEQGHVGRQAKTHPGGKRKLFYSRHTGSCRGQSLQHAIQSRAQAVRAAVRTGSSPQA